MLEAPNQKGDIPMFYEQQDLKYEARNHIKKNEAPN